MTEDCIAGETVRIFANKLNHIDNGPVASGATVTIEVYNPDGTLQSTGPGVAINNDWHRDVTMPNVVGMYEVKMTAVNAGATWKSHENYIRVSPY